MKDKFKQKLPESVVEIFNDYSELGIVAYVVDQSNFSFSKFLNNLKHGHCTGIRYNTSYISCPERKEILYIHYVVNEFIIVGKKISEINAGPIQLVWIGQNNEVLIGAASMYIMSKLCNRLEECKLDWRKIIFNYLKPEKKLIGYENWKIFEIEKYNIKQDWTKTVGLVFNDFTSQYQIIVKNKPEIKSIEDFIETYLLSGIDPEISEKIAYITTIDRNINIIYKNNGKYL